MKIVIISRSSATENNDFFARFAGIDAAQFAAKCERSYIIERGVIATTAQKRARAVLLRAAFQGRRILLVGSTVARAFGFAKIELRMRWIERDGAYFGLCPTPSDSADSWWCDVGNRAEACRFFAEIARADDA